VTLTELADLPADNDPARVASAPPLPADGAPAEAESSACAIPAPPLSKAAPTPKAKAADPIHE
jgi:hypothetical protein